jgi:hypothetical protein
MLPNDYGVIWGSQRPPNGNVSYLTAEVGTYTLTLTSQAAGSGSGSTQNIAVDQSKFAEVGI